MTCRIVAEISANHLGSLDRALRIVEAAKRAGAHAVKLQTWTPRSMVIDRTYRLQDGPWAGQNLAELYDQTEMPWEHQRAVFAHAAQVGIECFSSVFDVAALEFLQARHCQRYKVASFELVDLPLIRATAATKKPLILSTGMAAKAEIDAAVQTARAAGAKDITLLKCTSAYPADCSHANLATMAAMRRTWDVAVGLSDHTSGIGVAVAAAALGAAMIEKHLTLARDDGGPDAAFSVEPHELAQLVVECERASLAMGQGNVYGPTPGERPQLALRRSLYFTQSLPAGTRLAREHLRTARPAMGIEPRLLNSMIGARLVADVTLGTPVTLEAVERERKWRL